MATPPLVVPEQVEVVAKVTGEDSPNRTGTRFGFLATDLGILWDDGSGGVLVAFGDTYGRGWRGPGAGARSADHRRNILARTTRPAAGTNDATGAGPDLDSGLRLESVISDAQQHATEILPRDRRAWFESTVIPTSGIAIGGVQYLHYMSVMRWRRRGWRTNYGGIAYSTDGGRTWTKDRQARWRNSPLARRPFQLGAFTRDEHSIYLFGTRNGRFSDIYLARVEPASVGDLSRYEYWTGAGWTGARRSSQRRAKPVAHGPAGELSVAFHRGLGRWLMVHLDDPAGRIVLRAADAVTGPWSEGQVLVSAAEYPALYGGFLHPHALDGDTIYFTMSQWGPYNVFLVRARLSVR
ncbi:MAG: DUF4185 domain-containing protein [Pseudonocardia sp.]|nr:DUF4185 domain-containing protein [Pseudonocardia sp.]